MYVCMSFDYARRFLGNIIVLFPNDYGYLVRCPIWVCACNLVYYLAVQIIDDIAHKLSDLGKLSIVYNLPALTIFDQHSYLA